MVNKSRPEAERQVSVVLIPRSMQCSFESSISTISNYLGLGMLRRRQVTKQYSGWRAVGTSWPTFNVAPPRICDERRSTAPPGLLSRHYLILLFTKQWRRNIAARLIARFNSGLLLIC